MPELLHFFISSLLFVLPPQKYATPLKVFPTKFQKLKNFNGNLSFPIKTYFSFLFVL